MKTAELRCVKDFNAEGEYAIGRQKTLMIDHTGIGVRDAACAAAFYDAALGALGLRRVMQRPSDSGVDAVGYGIEYPIFWIDRFHPHGMRNHTACRAKNCDEVNCFHASALRAGGIDNGCPGFRDTSRSYPPNYYAAFVLDPDGNNVEAVCRGE